MKPEVYIALGSLVVAVIALFVSIFEIRRSRRESKLSRLPLLRVNLGTEEDGFVSFSVENEGDGAAFIEKFEILVNDEPVELLMIFTKIFGEGKEFVSDRLLHNLPKIVQANSKIEIFRIADSGPNAKTNVQLMHEIALKMGVNIKCRELRVDDERSEITIPKFAVASSKGPGVSL